MSSCDCYEKWAKVWCKYKKGRQMRYTFNKRLNVAIKSVKKGTILDIGAGDCQMILNIAKENKSTGFALDISKHLMSHSKKKYGDERLKYIISCAENLPLKNEVFDNVVCTVTIEHLMDRRKALNQMSKVLKKGGKIIITGVNPFYCAFEKLLGTIYKILNKPSLPVKITTKDYIIKILKKNGVSIKYVDGFTALPLKLSFIEKMEKRMPKFLRLNFFLNFVIVGVKN